MGGGFGGTTFLAGAILLAGCAAAAAAPCPGNPNALGTSRIMAVNPAEMPRIGTHDYGRTLPLAEREVVLTFDDGPISPYTERVLDVLQDHCVKALFFLVGRNARNEPQITRRILAAGHTIGTHTQNHPLRVMGAPQSVREISTGIVSVGAVLGNPKAVAPFFRFPGLHHTSHGEHYLRSLGIAAWSIDIDSHDWKRNSPDGVLHNILSRLEVKGRGIVLLHDVQVKTALLLPRLLAELKLRGYRVVHVVPSGPQHAPPLDLVASREPTPAKETTGSRSAQAPLSPVPPTPPRQAHWPIAVLARQPNYVGPSAMTRPAQLGIKPAPAYIPPMQYSARPPHPAKPPAKKPDRHAIFRW